MRDVIYEEKGEQNRTQMALFGVTATIGAFLSANLTWIVV